MDIYFSPFPSIEKITIKNKYEMGKMKQLKYKNGLDIYRFTYL